MKWLVNPFVMNIIGVIKEKDTNIYEISKKAKLSWYQARQAINCMVIYNLIDMKDTNPKTFSLTDKGLKVKEHLIQINNILRDSRKELYSEVVGAKDVDELKAIIDEDLK